MSKSTSDVIARLDEAVDDFCHRVRYFHEPFTEARARMFVRQHRLNTRQRNSVLKLKVATNTPDWDLRLDIIGAYAEEIIADDQFFEGKAHWQVLQELGERIGMDSDDIIGADPLSTTKVCWYAWDGLMGNRHWLLGLIGNTCAERANIPGYGPVGLREHGWFGMERLRWQKMFGLTDEDLIFFSKHEEADILHSDMGWKTVAERAADMHMEDAVVQACIDNLQVWEIYLNGIGDGADKFG